MNPISWDKQPWDERMLEFDPSPAISTGDSLASIDSVKVYDSGSDVSSTMLREAAQISDGKIYVPVTGGTNGKSYVVTVRCITTNGDKIEDDLIVNVKSLL